MRHAGAWGAIATALFCVGGLRASGAEKAWDEVKSKHFRVLYAAREDVARTVLERAEAYYTGIGEVFGFPRHKDFWLWDNRVRILLYGSRDAFREATKAPGWAAGRASAERREIAGWAGEDGFVDEVLPHELTHLMFRGYLGTAEAPRWLEEGVAQWVSPVRRAAAQVQGERLASSGEWVPWKDLERWEIPEDGNTAMRYYAQAAGLTAFLLDRYGMERFARFCRAMRDGRGPDDAFRFTYGGFVPSMEQVEREWVQSLRKGGT